LFHVEFVYMVSDNRKPCVLLLLLRRRGVKKVAGKNLLEVTTFLPARTC